MSDLKAFADQLIAATVREVNRLAAALREEYGLLPGPICAVAFVFYTCSCAPTRPQSAPEPTAPPPGQAVLYALRDRPQRLTAPTAHAGLVWRLRYLNRWTSPVFIPPARTVAPLKRSVETSQINTRKDR